MPQEEQERIAKHMELAKRMEIVMEVLGLLEETHKLPVVAAIDVLEAALVIAKSSQDD